MIKSPQASLTQPFPAALASDYYSGLSEADKARYDAKLRVNGVDYGDPYRVDALEWTLKGRRWPPVTMINITVYLLFTPSRFTPDTLQAYKSLEAYNYFESGHVRDVRLWQPDRHELCFVRADVKPSQRATGLPHDAWVCLDHKTGQVYFGHCTCKARRTWSLCTNWTSASLECRAEPFQKSQIMCPGTSSSPTKPSSKKFAGNPQAVVLRSIPKMDDEDTDWPRRTNSPTHVLGKLMLILCY
ncbi:hypothetical protein HPB47_019111 [Ixodes persulcatus]|uniref:Uncharacterized protein n=1 Tax=Ixodes persulcatus TaxID=34615 RepID=A0AC60QJW1_IXOPE|nr:hypothetical protein HPB47_019111 [Ixodes persulcatus]